MEQQEQTNTEDSGTPPVFDEDTDLTAMSDDQLESFRLALDEGQYEESEDEEPELETSSDESGEEEDPQDAASESDESSQQEEQEGGSEERIEQLEKQLRNKQQFIQKQASELGELRKAKLARKEELENSLQDVFEESALKGLEQKDEIKKLQEDVENLDTEERMILRRANNEQIYTRHFGGKVVVNMPELTALLEEDNVPQEAIKEFADDPFGKTDALALIQLSKRAILTRYLREAINQLKSKDEEIEELQKEPEKVLSGVKKALKQKPSVNGSSGNAKTVSKAIGGIGTKDLAKLSQAELDELTAEAGISF